MKLITKNFRLNALANQYAAALYNRITQQSGGEFFTMKAGEQAISVNILGGVSGVRMLVDSYYLEALQQNYPQWERLAIHLFDQYLDGNDLTPAGWHIWQSMVNDMSATLARNGGGLDA
ncbi:hypothetical protein [Serratia sp. UGAL515B_01]|uniref:hypothetical protein n=1 Tax=Serratia sp. UGAL515B_01 TaxID=2986763 RepID=UPI0029557357|nr:hypothetical protein [Serratia sp. UGAL515B_01]WON77022.1 hypothetical protein OK023_17935 [Serratia sp. UGAL515B_01]